MYDRPSPQHSIPLGAELTPLIVNKCIFTDCIIFYIKLNDLLKNIFDFLFIYSLFYGFDDPFPMKQID